MNTELLREDERTAIKEVYPDALKGSYSAVVGVFLTKWVPLIIRRLIAERKKNAELSKYLNDTSAALFKTSCLFFMRRKIG